jgi:peptidoglycan/LPS O-acetylase OafA/YrhL
MRPELVATLLVGMIVLLVLISPHGHNYQVYYSPFTRAAELLFGCLGAVIWRHRMVWRSANRIRSLGLKLPSLSHARAGGIGVGRSPALWRSFVACALAYMFARLLFNYQLDTEQIYLRSCLIAVPLIMTLLSAPASLMARLIASPPLRYLGRISYSLYLFHPHGSIDLNALLTIAISVALASVSWKLLESRVLARPMPERSSAPSHPLAASRPLAQPPVLAEQSALA